MVDSRHIDIIGSKNNNFNFKESNYEKNYSPFASCLSTQDKIALPYIFLDLVQNLLSDWFWAPLL